MNARKIIASTLFISVVLYSCNWDDFGDLNVNPNAATVPKTSALLTNSMVSNIAGTIVGPAAILTNTQFALYAQHLANKQYTSADNYQTINFNFDIWYSGPLADLQKIIDFNSDEATKEKVSIDGSNANQIAVAKIMQSYYFLFITNRWGDVPYSEALKGDKGILTPKFDSQEAIYDGCIATLKEAAAMIDGGEPVHGDVILDGDMDMWKKFANTTRLMAALRLSKVNPTKARAEFLSAYNAGVIALDNSENVFIGHTASSVYENFYYNSFVTGARKDWTVAETMLNKMQLDTYTSPHSGKKGILNVVQDPRLAVYANPIENTTSTFIGMPYGLSEATAGAVPNSQVSFIGNRFRQRTSSFAIYTAAQVAFTLAEGVLNGWIPGDAQQLYLAGIKASLDQHGVGSDYASYITNTEVAYNPTRARELIGTQKWIALFPDGFEAWTEWRRTGYPVLTPAANAQNTSKQIPRRQGYGTNERNLNTTNYNEALARQGFTADDLDQRLWWDKN